MRPIISSTLNELKTRFQKSWEWRIGYVLIGSFLLARGLGLFSSLELVTLDFFLRHRPPEEEDQHVVIVLIDRTSSQDNQTMTDGYLAELLETILSNDPAVVGFNIFREETTNKVERLRLAHLFEKHENLVGVQKILPPNKILPLAEVSDEISNEQFGFNDVPIDQDGKVRRVFIGSYLPDNTPSNRKDNPFKFSFSFTIAEKYLASKGYELENLPADPETPSFKVPETGGFVGITRLKPTFGGYVRDGDISDIQTLLNFRSGTRTFDIFYADGLLDKSFNFERLKGKVVIVGATDSLFPRFLPVSASSNLGNKEYGYRQILPRLGITGAELEAHAASQIINAVLNERPLIEATPRLVEIVLIMMAGVGGILISNAFQTAQATIQNTLLLASTIIIVIVSSYLTLYLTGIWLPVFPISSILAITGIAYIAFYQSERLSLTESKKLEEDAQKLAEERRNTIDQIFNSIHAGPLQTLAGLLRNVRDGKLEQTYLLEDLEFLNREIRGIGERLRQEAIEDVYFVDARRDIKLDLNHPMHEVFYEIYNHCLQKELPGFQNIKVRSVVFESFDSNSLDIETKKKLCWFLQESLENVGKHALGTTRLFVTGKKDEESYTICIEDNGPGICSSHIGEGTKFFHRLEKQLEGKFSRESKPERGTICKLTWSLADNKRALQRLYQQELEDAYFEDSRRNVKLDLKRPLHTLFYEICHSYLQEDMPGFQSIETCSFAFEPCQPSQLTLEIRRKLCTCLQASLENVGKHAPGTTRLIVTGTLLDGFYTLYVEDNGPGIVSSYTGEGTKLFYQLEELLQGKFSRVVNPNGGTICKLTWPLRKVHGGFIQDPGFRSDPLSL